MELIFIFGWNFVLVSRGTYFRGIIFEEDYNYDISVWHKFKLRFVGLLNDGFLQ